MSVRLVLSVLVPLSAVAATTLSAAPIAVDSTNPVNRTNGTVRIVLSGESGVQYFVRSTTSLANNEWKLAQTNGVNGNQTPGEIGYSAEFSFETTQPQAISACIS